MVKWSDLSEGHERRVVASAFFEILTLKTWDRIDVAQDAPYADIMITKSEFFDLPVPGQSA